jgi:hypothetical protein
LEPASLVRVSSLHLIFYVFPILDGLVESAFLIAGCETILSTKTEASAGASPPVRSAKTAGHGRQDFGIGDGLELGATSNSPKAECAEDRPASGYLNTYRSDISVTFRSNRVFLPEPVLHLCHAKWKSRAKSRFLVG